MVPLPGSQRSQVRDERAEQAEGKANGCESVSVRDLLLERYKVTYRKSDAASGGVERSECRAVR